MRTFWGYKIMFVPIRSLLNREYEYNLMFWRPCGTSACISLIVDISPSTEIPYLDSLNSKRSCHVVWKAFSTSKNTTAVDMLLLKLRVTWPFSLAHCIVLWRARSSNWLSLNYIFSLVCHWTIFKITFLNSLSIGDTSTVKASQLSTANGQSASLCGRPLLSGTREQIFFPPPPPLKYHQIVAGSLLGSLSDERTGV
jgi:hypothetical protein